LGGTPVTRPCPRRPAHVPSDQPRTPSARDGRLRPPHAPGAAGAARRRGGGDVGHGRRQQPLVDAAAGAGARPGRARRRARAPAPIRYEREGGAPLPVTPAGAVTCARAGGLAVRATLGRLPPRHSPPKCASARRCEGVTAETATTAERRGIRADQPSNGGGATPPPRCAVSRRGWEVTTSAGSP
jgi:hypothetical protein